MLKNHRSIQIIKAKGTMLRLNQLEIKIQFHIIKILLQFNYCYSRFTFTINTQPIAFHTGICA